jgi:hypothetical protein
MTKKQEKEYQDEIKALNSYILEMNDQNKAIGDERDRFKELSEKLTEKCLLHGVSISEASLPTSRYHHTLNSIDNRIKEAFNSDTEQDWKWNLGLARKTIREEKQLYPLEGNEC